VTEELNQELSKIDVEPLPTCRTSGSQCSLQRIAVEDFFSPTFVFTIFVHDQRLHRTKHERFYPLVGDFCTFVEERRLHHAQKDDSYLAQIRIFRGGSKGSTHVDVQRTCSTSIPRWGLRGFRAVT
jgi:hypothetical protein